MQPGNRVGPYELVAPIGEGGMGVVWEALDTRLDRSVALKFLPEGVADDPDTRARFEREARAASALSHPNICVLYDIGEHDGRPFLVMELLRGAPLNDQLAEGPLAESELQQLALHVARALDAAHDREILHRDLKPANIFRLNTGETKILDFGVAKMAAPDAEDATELTAAGTLLGTVKYMSPEQALGKSLDGRSDLFSLGAVLYEAATGAPPFAEGSVGATLNAVVNDDTVTLSGSTVEFSDEFAQIVDRLLVKEPSGRFASAAHLVETLERARSAGPETSGSSLASGGSTPPGGITRGDDADGTESTSPSIAVLPFANFSADPDSDFFSDGLAEELTTGLSRVKGLRVAARSSAFRFKDRDVDAREAGRELGVSSVLEGSVRRAGQRVRITVQLIDVTTGYQSWSERYDGTLEDVFQIQEDTAVAIVEQLQVRLGSSGEAQVLRQHTANSEAYEMYLRGRFHWERRYRGEQLQALACFRSAVAIDPDYALAHVGIADVHWSSLAYVSVPGGEALSAARAALARALELDPVLPEAHASQAILATMESDWERAEALYERALELDPNYWLAHAYRGIQAGALLRGGDASRHVARALELEPGSAYAHGIGSLAVCFAGDFEAAIDLGRRGVEFDASVVLPHVALALAYSEVGDHVAAVDHAERSVQTSQRGPFFVGVLALVCGRGGDRERCERLLGELERRGADEYVNRVFLGMAHLGAGDLATARRYYVDAVAQDRPSPWVVLAGGRPFAEVLESYNLPVAEGHTQADS